MHSSDVKRIATFLMAIIMVFTTMQPMQAVAARTVTVFRVDGDNAAVYRNGTRHSTARTRTRLAAADELITGRETQVYLNMDSDSLLKMDSQSRVAFELTNNLIGLTVLEGNALVRVAEQAEGRSLESRVGNVVHAVRGTMFTIGHFNENIVYIAMLSGSGEVSGVSLEEGQILTSWYEGDELDVQISGVVVHDLLEDGTNVVISEIVVDELDQFTLQEIWDNQDYLLENSGFVDHDILEEVRLHIIEETIQNLPQPPQSNVINDDINDDWYDYNNDTGTDGGWNYENPGGGGGGSGGGNQGGGGGTGGDGSDGNGGDSGGGNQGGGGLPPGFITIGGMNVNVATTSIRISGVVVSAEEFEQLKYVQNLRELIMSNANITDISPLAGLTNLTYLELQGNNISDLTPLEGLTSLRWLFLGGNNITDISSLAELSNLESLALGFNNITDWSPVDHINNVGGRPPNWPRSGMASLFAPIIPFPPANEEPASEEEFWDIDLDDLLTLTPEFDVTFPEIDLDDLLTLTPEVDIIIDPDLGDIDEDIEDEEEDKKESEEETEDEDEDKKEGDEEIEEIEDEDEDRKEEEDPDNLFIEDEFEFYE
ncbi:MAG: leucine-rich repeat domain-containing protein [Turicibacter sp.]|nr:leucine-rich repeat domain-containing protein [Turicibacter sp.]